MSTARHGSNFWVGLGLIAVVACLAWIGRGASQGQPPAQPSGGPPKGKLNLPEGLRHVPQNAAAFVHVRLGELLQSDAGKTALKMLGGDGKLDGFLAAAQKEIGLSLHDVESVTLVFLEPPFLGGRKAVHSRDDVAIPKPANEAAPPPPRLDKEFDTPKPDNQKPEAFQPVSVQILPGDGEHGPAGYDPSSRLPVVMITTSAAYDRKKLLKRFVLDAQDDNVFARRGDVSVVFLSDRSFMVGVPATLLRFVSPPDSASAAGPLFNVLALGEKKHLVIAGGRVSVLAKHLLSELLRDPFDIPPPTATFAPLLNLASAGLTFDLDQGPRLALHLEGANRRGAALAQQALQAGLDTLDLALENLIADGKNQREPLAPAAKDMIGKLRQALASAKIGPDEGGSFQVKLEMPMEPAALVAAFSQLAGQVTKASSRTQSMNNLKQIALAMHSHHDVYKGLPPAGLTSIKDPTGKPLLSWRVAILPFIEQQPLYQQFDLDLSWDHPRNKKLIEQMPQIYAAPGVKNNAGMTHYQVFVGKHTAFEPLKERKGNANIRLHHILDGTSNTLMVVEAAEPVIWTKPDDLPFDPKGPLPKLGGLYGKGFHGAFCDGYVRFISNRVDEKTLRLLIMRDDGEAFQLDP